MKMKILLQSYLMKNFLHKIYQILFFLELNEEEFIELGVKDNNPLIASTNC